MEQDMIKGNRTGGRETHKMQEIGMRSGEDLEETGRHGRKSQ